MKNPFYFIIFMCLPLVSWAQYEISYTYTIHRDSIKTRGKITEEMSVWTQPQENVYVMNKLIHSFMVSKRYKGMQAGDIQALLDESQQYFTKMDKGVWKLDWENNQQELYVNQQNKHFVTNEPLQLPQWKIGKETKIIKEYTVKKATTQFLGRNWIAWYTEELPYHAAPFLFYGLPGLIVELEDENQYMHFQLSAIRTPNEEEWQNLNEYLSSIPQRSTVLSPKEMQQALQTMNENYINYLETSGIQYDEKDLKKIEQNRAKRQRIFIHPQYQIVM
ncbi:MULTISPECIES: GLPGLI family protein [Weeksella]|uniref:GLPGLI family protein n=1 Tax=Weeksella TaxID=1013 RepID=UPI0008CAB878|nr:MULTISPECIES: GLPGLI family protein [Weeksella]MDK7375895.1 GLPGLI family protein [Weeksella virosa]OFM83825.1 hypothetical protein HMPREF2660_09860 [Weeksella sp. HMSC059D05]